MKSWVVDPATSRRYRLVKPQGGGLSGAVGGGGALLLGETDGFATDFTYATDGSRVAVKVADAVTNYAVDAFYINASTSPKMVTDISGNLGWAPHNLIQQSENLATFWTLVALTAVSATQIRPTAAASTSHRLNSAVTVVVGDTYTDQIIVSYPAGSTYKKLGIGVSGGSMSGNIAFDIEAGTVIYSDIVGWTCTIAPGPAAGQFTITTVAPGMNSSGVQIYLLNPTYTTGNVAAVWTATDTTTGINIHRHQVNRGAVPTAYLQTTTTNRMGLALDYDPVTHAPLGLKCEPNITNLLLNSAALSTQSVTVAASMYSLSFWGTGTVTLSGVSTAGPLVGTSATNRVQLLFTPTAGSLTLTVTGTVSNAQLELAYNSGTTSPPPTSYIPTFAATATRTGDSIRIPSITSINPSITAGSWWIDMNLIAGANGQGVVVYNNSLGQPIYVHNTILVGISDGTNLVKSWTAAGVHKIASAYQNADRAITYDGLAVVTDAGQTTNLLAAPTGYVAIGAVYNGSAQIYGYIRKIRHVPRRKTNAELVTETTIASTDVAPVNTVAPVISGTATVGQTLSCTTGTWTGTPTPTYAYQWKRGGVSIGSATASTYLLVSADAGALITCTVTATNTAGSASATSNSLGAVIWLPANTVAPVISGTVTVGQTLSCTTGTWTGSPTPTYAYQWKRTGVSIGSATASTYVLVIADVAATIACEVTATNTAGSVAATSNSLGPVIAGAAEMLVGETDGFAADFTYATNSQRVAKKVSSAITSYDPDSFFSNTALIPKMIHNSSGAWEWTPHNIFLNSESPATQTIGTVIGEVYTVTVTGSGSLVGSAGATGTATQAAPLTFTATGTGATFTLSGSLTRIQANKGTTACAYLATTAAVRNALAIDYDPVTLVCKGLLLEPTATNLLLNSATLSTQSVTVTAALHALSFYGTGTVTLSGVSTAGPLVGTGVNNRVSLQFTPTAGTLTLTVSGSVTFANLETNVNGFVTSWIPTFGVTQQRNGDSYNFLLSLIPSLGSAYSHYVRFSMQVVAGGSRFPFCVTDGSSNNFAGIWDTASSVRLQVSNAGSSVGTITGPALIANTVTAAAARFATNDCALSVSGGAVGTDTTVALPTVDSVRTGTSGNTASASFQFYIEKMVIVSRAWDDATLISKSST